MSNMSEKDIRKEIDEKIKEWTKNNPLVSFIKQKDKTFLKRWIEAFKIHLFEEYMEGSE